MSKPVYLVYGEDDYLVAEKARELAAGLLPEAEREFGLDIIDGRADRVAEACEAIEQCLAALKTVGGLFSSRKVVWLQNATFFGETVLGRSARVKDALVPLVALIKEGLVGDQVLLVSATKVSKRYAFYKTCKAVGELHEFAVSDKGWQNEKRASQLLGDLLAKKKLKMSAPTRQAFLEKVGTDTRHLVGEVEKLAVYAGDCGEATADDVAMVSCSARGALAWDLLDAFGERRLGAAVTALRQLLFQKESAHGLLASLVSRIRDLMTYRDCMDRGWLRMEKGYRGPEIRWGTPPPEGDQLLSAFAKDPRKAHPFYAGKLAAQARRYRLGELQRALDEAIRTQQAIVSSAVDPALLLEVLLVRTVGKGPAGA